MSIESREQTMKTRITDSLVRVLQFCLLMVVCLGCSGPRSIGSPSGEYHGNSVTLRFDDNNFEYIKREGSLTLSEYATGTFALTSRNKIALVDTTSFPPELKTTVSFNSTDKPCNTIAINIVNNAFDIEQLPTEFFQIDLYINGRKVKTLEKLASEITSQERIDSLWLSAFVRTSSPEKGGKTMLSKKIAGSPIDNGFYDIKIKLDFSLGDFYRIRFLPDILTFKSRERIYWRKRNLTLYKIQ